MRKGQRVKTDNNQMGTIRYRYIDHYVGKRAIWFCCITPDNWDGKGETLIMCPQKRCQPVIGIEQVIK